MAKWVKAHIGFLEEASGYPDSSAQEDYASSPKVEKCISTNLRVSLSFIFNDWQAGGDIHTVVIV